MTRSSADTAVARGALADLCVAERGAAAPARVLIAPAGERTVRGVTWRMDGAAAAELIAAFVALGRDLVIDYEHQSLGGEYAAPDGVARAAGWISGLEWVDGDGLYAAVSWTARAAEMIAARELRYLSPVLLVRRADARPIALLSVAATNDPAIAGMRPIAATMDMWERVSRALKLAPASAGGRAGDVAMTKIASSLGLPDGADEAAVVTAIEALGARAQAGDALRVAASQALGLAAESGPDVIVSAAARLRSAAAGAVPAEEHAAVVERLTAVERSLREREREAWLQRGMDSGRIVAASRERWAEQYDRDPAAADALLAVSPVVVRTGRVVSGPPAGGGDRPARAAVIAAARSEYQAEPTLQAVCSVRGYVMDRLSQAGHTAPLTQDELLAIA